MNGTKTVIVVGRNIDDFGRWELCGVFDKQCDADSACTTTSHWYGRVEMNVRLPEREVAWPDAIFPRLTDGRTHQPG